MSFRDTFRWEAPRDDMNETCFRMTGIPNETGILGAGWVGRSDTYDKHVGVLPKKHQHM